MTGLSASSLWRAEKCPASSRLPRIEQSTPAAERGREMHADKEREAPDGAEVAYAFDVVTGTARELGRRLARNYPKMRSTEIVGTADRLTVEADRVVIRDYKTGAGFGIAPPETNIQLGFLAVCAASVEGKDRAGVELDFLDQDRVVSADLDAFALAAFRERVRAIWNATGGETPKVVTGDHCNGCPCIVNCPAHLTMAIAFSEGIWPDVMPADGLTVTKVAQGWEYLKNAKRIIGLVEKTYRAFASEWPVPLGDGRVLGAHEVEREELDGVVTFQVLRDLHGEAVARAAVTMEATKTRLGEALKPIAMKGARASMVREALTQIRAANGVNVKRGVRVEEFKQEE